MSSYEYKKATIFLRGPQEDITSFMVISSAYLPAQANKLRQTFDEDRSAIKNIINWDPNIYLNEPNDFDLDDHQAFEISFSGSDNNFKYQGIDGIYGALDVEININPDDMMELLGGIKKRFPSIQLAAYQEGNSNEYSIDIYMPEDNGRFSITQRELTQESEYDDGSEFDNQLSDLIDDIEIDIRNRVGRIPDVKYKLPVWLEPMVKDDPQELLKWIPDANFKPKDGWSISHYAAINGASKCLRALMEQGADPMEVTPQGLNLLELVLHRCEDSQTLQQQSDPQRHRGERCLDVLIEHAPALFKQELTNEIEPASKALCWGSVNAFNAMLKAGVIEMDNLSIVTRDVLGKGNHYVIKSYINGLLENYPDQAESVFLHAATTKFASVSSIGQRASLMVETWPDLLAKDGARIANELHKNLAKNKTPSKQVDHVMAKLQAMTNATQAKEVVDELRLVMRAPN